MFILSAIRIGFKLAFIGGALVTGYHYGHLLFPGWEVASAMATGVSSFMMSLGSSYLPEGIKVILAGLKENVITLGTTIADKLSNLLPEAIQGLFTKVSELKFSSLLGALFFAQTANNVLNLPSTLWNILTWPFRKAEPLGVRQQDVHDFREENRLLREVREGLEQERARLRQEVDRLAALPQQGQHPLQHLPMIGYNHYAQAPANSQLGYSGADQRFGIQQRSKKIH